MELVDFVSRLGFSFLQEEDGHVLMRNFEETWRFKLHRVNEFTSDRKRMSVLVTDLTDGKTKLLIKGADNIISERLNAQHN